MSENQSISKKENMDYQPGLDLLSDLPLSIIHIILAFVPTKDAIRTCVLSRRWRYIWASLPQLDITGRSRSRGLDDKAIGRFEEYMENFITNALFHHKGPIHKFKMSVPFIFRSPDIAGWVPCLSKKDIRELLIEMDYEKRDSDCSSLHLHSSLYSCEKLTCLVLFYCELDPPPSTFKGFLFLRDLCLKDMHLSSNGGTEYILADSPFLEKLEIIEAGSSELRISAPNLKDLYLSGGYVEISLYAPLLTEIYVLVTYDGFAAEHQPQKSSVCNYTNIFGSLTKLEKLGGEILFTKFLSIGIESCRHSLVFHHLKHIELELVNFEDIEEISVVARLIIGAPNLRVLKIITNLDSDAYDALEAPHVSFSDFGFAPDFTFEKLRAVHINGVCRHPAEIAFIKFLLEASPVLETMGLDLCCRIPTKENHNLMAELLSFCRASPKARILIK